MKFILLKTLLLFYVTNSYTQETFKYSSVAEYSLIWQPDSLNISSRITTENYILYISNKKSFFISSNRIGLDTIIYNNATFSDVNKLMSLPYPTSNKRIINSADTDKMTIYNEFRSKLYKYYDTVNINWKINKIKDSIAGILVQKATGNFRGRKYTAWFANSIPIPEGPYKFKGLPGLILSVYDDRKHLQFKIVSFKENKNQKKIIFNYESESVSINKNDYFKIENSYSNNPIPLMESQGAVFTEDTKRIIRERFKNRNKSNNNRIELIQN